MSVLPPAGLIGMDHRTASDPFHYVGHHPLGLASRPLGCIHDGTQAETQPMDSVQVPLDGAERQPGFLPQVDDQADQVDPQTLLAHHHAVQLRRWHTAASAKGAGAGHIDMLGYLHRNLGQVNHFPSALGPAAGQLGAAVGTLLYHMLHPLGGRHAGAGKAMGPRLAWFLGLGRPLLGFGLQTGHPTGAARFVPPFQLGNPFLQALDDGLLPHNDGNQQIPVGSAEVDFPIHSRYMT